MDLKWTLNRLGWRQNETVCLSFPFLASWESIMKRERAFLGGALRKKVRKPKHRRKPEKKVDPQTYLIEDNTRDPRQSSFILFRGPQLCCAACFVSSKRPTTERQTELHNTHMIHPLRKLLYLISRETKTKAHMWLLFFSCQHHNECLLFFSYYFKKVYFPIRWS